MILRAAKSRAVWALLLCALGAAVFGGSLRAPFVYDDDGFVVLNRSIRSLSAWPSFFREPATLASDAQLAHDNYRPLTTLSFALNYAAGALDPFGYHLANLLLHLAAAWLLFLYAAGLLRRGGADDARAEPAAFLAAALFLVHPVQVESVVWISGRSNLLASVFVLAALLVRRRGRAGAAAALALGAAALLSKEIGVVLPALILLEEALFGGEGSRWRRAAAAAAPSAALVAAYLVLRSALLGRVGQTGYWGGSFALTQLTMARAWLTYARLLVWPHPLSLEYLFPVEHDPAAPRVLAAAALIAGALTAAWRARARRPARAFGLGLVVVGLLPVSNLIPLKAIMAERFLYLSVAGAALAAADAWTRVRARRAWTAAAAAAVLACAVLSARRGEDWGDPLRLIEATLRECPQSARMHYGLGRALAARGRFAEAAEQFRVSLSIDPASEDAARDLGRAAFDAGLDAGRLREFRSTLQTRVNEPDALFELGSAALKAGETDMAVEALGRAARLAPARADAASNLAAALAASGRVEEAAALARETLRLHPDAELVRRNLARWDAALSRSAPAVLRGSFPAVAERFAQTETDFSPAQRLLPDGRRAAGLRPSAEEPGAALTPEQKALRSLARRELGALPRFFYAAADGGVALSLGRSEIAMTPLYGSGTSSARVEGGFLVYPRVLPDLDVLFAQTPGACEKLYLLSKPLPAGALRYRLTAAGDAADVRVENGALAVRDRSGARSLVLTPPLVIDSAGRTASARYALARADGARAWTLTLSYEGRGLRYPVLIDPTWTAGGAGTLTAARTQHTVTLLPSGKVLVAGGVSAGAAVATAELYDPLAGTWTGTGSMSAARAQHTATLLFNGGVLVVGGVSGATALSTAELYNPVSGSWSTTTSLTAGVYAHSATLLNDGRIFIAGGNNGAGALNTGAVYDPNLQTWTAATNTLTTAVQNHIASLLPNGNVLIAGGQNAGTAQAQAAVYNPVTNAFSATGAMNAARYNHVGARLPSGVVLVAGGYAAGAALGSAEYYNVGGGTWTATGALLSARELHVAAVLPSGGVVVAGGTTGAAALSSAELYTPSAGTWAALGTLALARSGSGAALMPNGKFLVAGGSTTLAVANVDLLDIAAGTYVATGAMNSARAAHTSTLLANGLVLAAGGEINAAGTATATAELYNPATNAWTTTGSMLSARLGHTASILPNGNVLIAGGAASFGSAPYATCELYNPTAGTFSTTGSLTQARFIHTSTLLNNGKVLVTGGSSLANGANNLKSAELYDPNNGAWTTTGNMIAARINHSAAILINNNVLIVGGQATLGGAGLSTAELYNPNTGTFATTGSMSVARGNLEAILINGGNVLALGGSSTGANALATAEIYKPGTGAWTLTGTMTTARQQPTATLLPNSKILAVGGEDNAAAVLSSAELYDPASGTWSTTAGMPTVLINQTATLLPSGRVLQAGGINGLTGASTVLNSADTSLYTEYNFSAVRPVNQPSIGTINGIVPPATINLIPGFSYTITGSSFTGVGDAAGGASASGNNLPHFVLRGNDTGTTPPQEQSAEFVDLSTSIYVHPLSSTTMTFDIPTSIGYGHYEAFVISNGVISTGAALGIFPVPPTSAPTATAPTFSPPPDDVSLIVNWVPTGEAGVTSYVIEVSTSASFVAPDFFGTGLGGTASSGTVTGLLSNTTYYARVAAESAGGQGPYSATLGSTSTLSVPVVSASTSFVHVNISSISVGWAALPNAPPSASAEAYVLQASTSPVFALPLTSSQTAVMAASTLTATGLYANTTYYFELSTLNWNGVPDTIIVGSTMTLPVPAQPVAPPFPAIGSSSFTVSWASGTAALGYNGPTTTYAVQVSTMANYTGTVFSTSTSNLSAPLTGLFPNTTYFAEVGVLVGVSTKSYTQMGSTSTLALPPNPMFSPVNFTSVTVTWTPYALTPSSMTEEGFTVLASTAPDFSGTVFSSSTLAPSVSSLTVAGLTMLTTYYMKLGAVNWESATNYVLVGTTVTLDQIPAITTLSASSGTLGDTIALTWNAQGVQGGAGTVNNGFYIVDYTTDVAFATGAGWSPAGAPPSDVTRLTISTTAVAPGAVQSPTLTGLLDGATYFVRVYTEDYAGYYSPLSNGATAYSTPKYYALALSQNVINVTMTSPSQATLLSTVTVTNIGNVGTTVQLSITNPLIWTATALAPGPDTFRLTGIFSSLEPLAGSFNPAFDLISTVGINASTSTFALSGDPASVQGFNIQPNQTRNLFMLIELPPTTSTNTQTIPLQAYPSP